MTNIRVETEKLQSVAGQLKSNSTSIGGVGGRLLNLGSSVRTYDNNSFGPQVKAICSEANSLASKNSGNISILSACLSKKVTAFMNADSTFQSSGQIISNKTQSTTSFWELIKKYLNSEKQKRELERRWKEMTLEQRRQYLNDFQKRILNSYGYTLVNPAIIFDDLEDPFLGDYKGHYFKGKVTIDITNLEKPWWRLEEASAISLLTTVAHENRHAMQHYAIANPDFRPKGITDDKVDVWRENLTNDNYIRSEDDFEEYRKQPVEQDARDFADSYVNDFFDSNNSSW